MNIKFKLPTGGSGIPASMICGEISSKLLLWCAMYGYKYQDLVIGRIHGDMSLGVEFKKSDMFGTFRITWDGREYERYTKQL
tara:strand:+ start:584 stop:829 length:246 start_codon:yes stop_codon:yes gene_type:complete